MAAAHGVCVQDTFVAMPDIPTYFKGMWEKTCGRCQSLLLPLHIAVLQKKHDLVR